MLQRCRYFQFAKEKISKSYKSWRYNGAIPLNLKCVKNNSYIYSRYSRTILLFKVAKP